jgi:glutamine---fructose-6-phosphate transaminase (isomerizing)
MTSQRSAMEREAREAPEAVARFLERNGHALQALGEQLRRSPPRCLVTSARGSSDHAASYLKYVCEIMTGTPVASIGPSVVSVYGAELKLRDLVLFSVSRSGRSPDLVKMQVAAKASGATAVAIVNTEESPIAQSADVALLLQAGAEVSVAATKSFIVSLVAAIAVMSEWKRDEQVKLCLQALPDSLRSACAVDWSNLIEKLKNVESLYVLGRGPSFPIAQEIALKLKETCAIHAEAYSTAEVLHGPLELVRRDFTVLSLIPADAAASLSLETGTRMRKAGAHLVEIGTAPFPFAKTGHPLLEPISIIQSFYLLIEALARARNRNPDQPAQLQKVTETV